MTSLFDLKIPNEAKRCLIANAVTKYPFKTLQDGVNFISSCLIKILEDAKDPLNKLNS